MGKFKMPSLTKFIKRKYIYGPKKDPVWVYIEQQMKAMEEQGLKPYNNRVGNWLNFLRDLRYFFHCEEKRNLKQLWEAVGPPWFFEYSPLQREVLTNMAAYIRQDVIDNHPTRVRIALREIGVNLKFTKDMLLTVIQNCQLDAAIFFWDLFNLHYRQPPSVLMPKYELNAKLLISAIVFLDLEECIQELDKLCKCTRSPSPPKEREIKKYWEPKIKFGAYLQKLYVPVFTRPVTKEKRPCPLPMKIKIQSEEFYLSRALNDAAISLSERRLRQIEHVIPTKRICNYKFWQPPIIFPSESSGAKAIMYAIKLKMYKSLAQPKHLKLLPQYPNEVVQIGNVSFSGGSPVYIINTTSYVSAGYIIHNGGKVLYKNEHVTLITGHYLYPKRGRTACEGCTCIETWDERVMNHLKNEVCNCGHRFDFYNEGKPKEKYVHPPNKYGPLWVDHAKIYQFFFPTRDAGGNATYINWEDYIAEKLENEFLKDCVEKSNSLQSLTEPKSWEYLRAFFADLSKTPLLIPHLPQAYHLNMLCEWVRFRVHGKVGPKLHKQLQLSTERRWAALGHIDFRSRAYNIPFTNTELKHFNFTHRPLIGRLAQKMLVDFRSRTGHRQVERSQLWLASMKHDVYPSKHFTEIFFSYLPARTTDIQIINPFKRPAFFTFGSTCPLRSEEKAL